MTPKTEAERAAEEILSKARGIKISFDTQDNQFQWEIRLIESGFRAGEKSERVMKLVEALKFYADCLSNSGMIEGVINGGEYVPLGTLAKQALAEFEGEE